MGLNLKVNLAKKEDHPVIKSLPLKMDPEKNLEENRVKKEVLKENLLLMDPVKSQKVNKIKKVNNQIKESQPMMMDQKQNLKEKILKIVNLIEMMDIKKIME